MHRSLLRKKTLRHCLNSSNGWPRRGKSKDSVASHKKFESNYDLKFTLLSDTDRTVIEAYDIWKEKKLYGKTSMGVVRTTYLIDESGIIVFANDKVKAADDAEKMLSQL